MKKGNLLLVLLGTAVMTSCLKDKYSFDEVKIDYSPTIALPLIDANVITKDLLASIDTSVISAGADGVLRVVINDTIQTLAFSDVVSDIKINDTTSVLLSEALDAVTKAEIDLVNGVSPMNPKSGLSGGIYKSELAGIDSVLFISGDLEFTLKNEFPFNLKDVVLELKNIRSGAVIGRDTIANVPPNGSSKALLSLAGKQLSDSLSMNMVSYGTDGTVGVLNVTYSEKLYFIVNLLNPVISKFYGDLSAEAFPATTGDIDFDFGSDPLLNAFKFASPAITLYFDNSFGAPINLSPFALTFKGTGSTIPLTGLPAGGIDVAAGTAAGSVTTPFVIDNSSTNIAEALNSSPSEIAYSVEGAITGNSHFAFDTSKFRIRMGVEIPIHGSIEGLVILDTLDLELGSIVENAELIILRSVITNQFPLDGEIQMVFTNASYVALDSLIVPKADGTLGDGAFMKAAVIDANGITTADGASVKTNDFTLKKATLAKLGTTKHLILKVKISSGNNGTDIIKILDTYTMNVKLGVIAKVQLGELMSGE